MLTVYSKNNCPFCDQAKNFLKNKNINFTSINIEQDPVAREFVMNAGHRTVPQIYFDGKLFVEGGWQGLSKMSSEEIVNKLLPQTQHALTNLGTL
jgi:glutaredoxin 3